MPARPVDGRGGSIRGVVRGAVGQTHVLRLVGGRGRRLACVALVAGGLLIAHGTASAVTGKSPAAPAKDTTLMIGTPCTVSARACVDLTTQKAWLFKDNAIERGPVDITSGGPGEETPTGNFTVAWKDRNHISSNAAATPMPYSVFFATGGVAFHGGSLQRQSAGCVHLDLDDAIIFYDSLAIGAPVQVKGVAPARQAGSGTGTGTGSNDSRSRARDNRRGSDLPSDGPPIGGDSVPPSTVTSPAPSVDNSPPAGDSGQLITPGRAQPARNRGSQASPSSSPSYSGSDDLLGPAGG